MINKMDEVPETNIQNLRLCYSQVLSIFKDPKLMQIVREKLAAGLVNEFVQVPASVRDIKQQLAECPPGEEGALIVSYFPKLKEYILESKSGEFSISRNIIDDLFDSGTGSALKPHLEELKNELVGARGGIIGIFQMVCGLILSRFYSIEIDVFNITLIKCLRFL